MAVVSFITGPEENPRRDRRIIVLHAGRQGISNPNGNQKRGGLVELRSSREESPLDLRGMRWQVGRVLDWRRFVPCKGFRQQRFPTLSLIAGLTLRDVPLSLAWIIHESQTRPWDSLQNVL